MAEKESFMRKALTRLRTLCAALLVTWISLDTAVACVAHQPLDLGLVKKADIVIVGTIQDYSPPAYQVKTIGGLELKVPKDRSYALLRIEVLNVLKGQAPKILEVVWPNETFGYPSALPAAPSIIALTAPGSPFLQGRLLLGPIKPGDTSKAVVLQGSCSDAFIFPAVSEQADRLRKLVSGGVDAQ